MLIMVPEVRRETDLRLRISHGEFVSLDPERRPAVCWHPNIQSATYSIENNAILPGDWQIHHYGAQQVCPCQPCKDWRRSWGMSRPGDDEPNRIQKWRR